jgi:lipoyl synthase
MNKDLEVLIKKSRMISWNNFGKNISFYHPGMFWYHDSWGEYPAISITGNNCSLLCDHCKGKILEPMISVSDSQDLFKKCVELEKKGAKGILISGGSAQDGSLPWNDFIEGIHAVKEKTNLFVSIHCGILDDKTAEKLKKAGVDQALIDVIGDDETLRDVYHCDFGVEKIKQTLEILNKTNISLIPHIVIGLNYGEIKGEYKAIDMISKYNPEVVTFVSLMPLKGTPMQKISPVSPKQIARIMADARVKMPNILMSLGCARDRANPNLDVLAVELGVNRIALPSDEAIEKAKEYGLTINWQKTCCSLPSEKK